MKNIAKIYIILMLTLLLFECHSIKNMSDIPRCSLEQIDTALIPDNNFNDDENWLSFLHSEKDLQIIKISIYNGENDPFEIRRIFLESNTYHYEQVSYGEKLKKVLRKDDSRQFNYIARIVDEGNYRTIFDPLLLGGVTEYYYIKKGDMIISNLICSPRSLTSLDENDFNIIKNNYQLFLAISKLSD